MLVRASAVLGQGVRPATPNPRERDWSKRTWEARAMRWRHELDALVVPPAAEPTAISSLDIWSPLTFIQLLRNRSTSSPATLYEPGLLQRGNCIPLALSRLVPSRTRQLLSASRGSARDRSYRDYDRLTGFGIAPLSPGSYTISPGKFLIHLPGDENGPAHALALQVHSSQACLLWDGETEYSTHSDALSHMFYSAADGHSMQLFSVMPNALLKCFHVSPFDHLLDLRAGALPYSQISLTEENRLVAVKRAELDRSGRLDATQVARVLSSYRQALRRRHGVPVGSISNHSGPDIMTLVSLDERRRCALAKKGCGATRTGTHGEINKARKKLDAPV